MKKVSKLLSILLALSMVLSLCGFAPNRTSRKMDSGEEPSAEDQDAAAAVDELIATLEKLMR